METGSLPSNTRRSPPRRRRASGGTAVRDWRHGCLGRPLPRSRPSPPEAPTSVPPQEAPSATVTIKTAQPSSFRYRIIRPVLWFELGLSDSLISGMQVFAVPSIIGCAGWTDMVESGSRSLFSYCRHRGSGSLPGQQTRVLEAFGHLGDRRKDGRARRTRGRRESSGSPRLRQKDSQDTPRLG